MATGIRFNNAKNFAGELYATQKWTQEQLGALKLDGTDKFLSQGENGLKVILGLQRITDAATIGNSNVSTRYILTDKEGNQVGDAIDVLKDQFLQSATYDDATHKITFTFNLADGTQSTSEVDLSDLIDIYTASKGITKVGNDFQGVVDETTEAGTNGEKFLTVGANGFKVDGIKTEIETTVAPVITAVEKAVQFVASTITVPAGTSGVFTSEAIQGRVVSVSDANGVIHPSISYSANTIDCTTTLKADFGSTETAEAETWFVVVAKPIEV